MASPGTLIKPTSVAAVSCHAVSPGFSQLGLGTRPSRYISEFPLEEITCPQARISSNAHRRRPAQTWCACTDGHALLSVHLRRTRRDATTKKAGPRPGLAREWISGSGGRHRCVLSEPRAERRRAARVADDAVHQLAAAEKSQRGDRK